MLKALLISLSMLLLCAASLAQTAQTEPPRMLFGRVAVNRTHIAFYYAGDLWTVERGGGGATRVPAPAGESHNFPAYSPDGSQLAFSRQTGGNWDVFVMPASGGEARRLTFHPASDFVVGWSHDGKN